MAPETQARVFDPFFTTKSAGHGLGLAVVQGIVRSLRGAIHLASSPGAGSTFQILLPCAGPAQQPIRDAIPRAKAETQFREATILIVEDEDFLRQAVSKILRKSGLSAIEAADGSAALSLIRAHQNIDVLLLDISLPGASIREVFEEASRLSPDMKVIVTSAYSKETAAASLAGRVERFIRKPFRLDDLVESIRAAITS